MGTTAPDAHRHRESGEHTDLGATPPELHPAGPGIGVPTAEYGRALVGQGLDPPLEEQMCRACRPLPLLWLTATLADHLIDGRFHSAGAEALALPVALAIRGNDSWVVLEGGVACRAGSQKLAGDTVPERRRHVQVHLCVPHARRDFGKELSCIGMHSRMR